MRIILVAFIAVFAISMSSGQEFSKLDKSPLDVSYYPNNAAKRGFKLTAKKRAAAEPKIRILYSRPSAKDRKVFGGIVKFGKNWRIGANESTEIMFATDVIFGGKEIKAGRYSLIAVPTAESWTIHLNSQLDGWGQYTYKEDFNIASVTVQTQSMKDHVESLSIAMYDEKDNEVLVRIGWENTFVELPITLK